MKTCTECYGEPDLYYGCEDCGRPPRHHLMEAHHQLDRHAAEVAAGREPVAPVHAPGTVVSIVAVTFGDGTATIAA